MIWMEIHWSYIEDKSSGLDVITRSNIEHKSLNHLSHVLPYGLLSMELYWRLFEWKYSEATYRTLNLHKATHVKFAP